MLASPAAAASKWIDREIGWWLQHREPERLLIVLTLGTLTWDDEHHRFDPQRSSALNPQLADAFTEEPHWLDLRWAKGEADLSLANGRFQEAVADVAATLHGRPKDELTGDDQRQHRRFRVVAWTMVSLLSVTTVAAAGLAWWANQQRVIAERRLVDLQYVPAGLQALRAGDAATAMLWFVEALKLDAGDAYWESLHRSRLASILATHPRLVDIRWHDDRVFQVQLGWCGDVLSASRDGMVMYGRPSAPSTRTFDVRGLGSLKKAELGLAGTRLLTLSETGWPGESEGEAALWHAQDGTRIPWSWRDAAQAASPSLGADDAVIAGPLVHLGGTRATWSLVDGQQFSDGADGWFSSANSKLFASPSGRFVAQIAAAPNRVSNGALELRRVQDNKRVVDNTNGTIAAFDRLDRWMAVGGHDGKITLWDLQRFAPVERPLWYWDDGHTARQPMDLGQPIAHLDFFNSDDRHILFAAGRGGRMQTWNIVIGEPASAALTHPGGINAAALSPAGWPIATAGKDDTLRLWHVSPDDPIPVPLRLQHGNWYEPGSWTGADGVLAVAYSHDGDHLLSGSADGIARLWRLQSHNPRKADTEPSASIWRIRQPMIGRGQGLTVSASTEPIVIKDLPTKKAFRSVRYSLDNRFVAAMDEAKMVELWDRTERRLLASGIGPMADGVAPSADWLPGGRTIAITDRNTVLLWDMRSGAAIGSNMHHGDVGWPLLSPDGRRLVTVGANQFRLWDATTGEPLTPTQQTDDNINVVSYSDDGVWLLVAGAKRGQIFATRTGRPVALPVSWGRFVKHVALVAEKGKLQILEGSEMGELRVWDFSPVKAPLSELQNLAQVLSSRRIDETRSVVPLTRQAFKDAWQAVSASAEKRPDRTAPAPGLAQGCR